MEPTMRRLAALAIATLSLAACGGDDGNEALAPVDTPPPAAPGPQRGQLLENPPALLRTWAPQELLAIAGQNAYGRALLDLAFTPKCSVSVHQLRYQTVGAGTDTASASGALMIPSGTDPACQGPRPIVLYGHGTNTNRAYNIANLAAGDVESIATAAVFAAQGYLVV